jgi:hypothetical protein
VLALFRDPAFATVQPDAEPQLYGDKAEVPPDTIEPRQWLSPTPLQYRHLEAWAAGRFVSEPARPVERPEDLPEERPAALDRAVLDACIGGAFHRHRLPMGRPGAGIWTADMRSPHVMEAVDATTMAIPSRHRW